jgi:hypothetical protein
LPILTVSAEPLFAEEEELTGFEEELLSFFEEELLFFWLPLPFELLLSFWPDLSFIWSLIAFIVAQEVRATMHPIRRMERMAVRLGVFIALSLVKMVGLMPVGK